MSTEDARHRAVHILQSTCKSSWGGGQRISALGEVGSGLSWSLPGVLLCQVGAHISKSARSLHT